MKEIKVRWTGIRPLVINNGALCDPRHPLAKAMKKITNKMITESEEMAEKKDRLQYEGCWYLNDKGQPIVPSDNIEECLRRGAMKIKKGNEIKAAVLCSEAEYRIQYDGPSDIWKLYETPGFTLRKPVVISRSRVMKVRPMIPTGWKLDISFEYDENTISQDVIFDSCTQAGALIGLGDWRPKFGRFIAEKI